MKPFVNYIVEAGLSLGIFTLVYWFFLRSETRFKATRFYLLLALLFSTLLPFFSLKVKFFEPVNLSISQIESQVPTSNLLETVTVYASGIPAKVGDLLLSFNYSIMIYLLGAMAAFFVIAFGFFQLVQLCSKNRVYKLKKARLVVSNIEVSPYSFFNYIFINKDLTEQENWKTMVHHELEHVKQGHSFDILFIDFMMIFQWFNPFYWIIRHMVRENHEFLADTGVLQKGLITGAQYKKLLLSQAIGGRPVITSNFLNVKTIKKRFKMITKNNSRKSSVLKYILSIAFAFILIMFLAIERKADAGELLSSFVTNIPVVDNSTEQITVSFPEIIAVNNVPEESIEEAVIDESHIGEIELKAIESITTQTNNLKNDVESKNLETFSHDTSEVFKIVEMMPEFIGGDKALREYIASEVKYPKDALENNMEGKVYVSFVVNEDGEVQNTRIARGVCTSLDNEAMRVVNSFPKWRPGMCEGKAVKVSYTIPINFALGRNDKKKETDSTKSNTPDKNGVYVIVDDMPDFPGGDLALRKHIAKNLVYPKIAAESGKQGKVYITFVVDADGMVKNLKVARGVNAELDAEAMRVVSELPKWKPGYEDGKPVPVSYTVPVNFALQ